MNLRGYTVYFCRYLTQTYEIKIFELLETRIYKYELSIMNLRGYTVYFCRYLTQTYEIKIFELLETRIYNYVNTV